MVYGIWLVLSNYFLFSIITRSILHGYFNPLVFWYWWEYLLTSKEFNFCRVSKIGNGTIIFGTAWILFVQFLWHVLYYTVLLRDRSWCIIHIYIYIYHPDDMMSHWPIISPLISISYSLIMILVETWPAVDDPTGGVLLTLSVSIGAMPVKPVGKNLKKRSYSYGYPIIIVALWV